MSNPDGSDDKIQQRVEIGIVKRFAERFSKKVDNIQQRYAKNPQDFQLQEQELKILYGINNSGLLEGAAAGVVSLIVLRQLRAALLRRVQRSAYFRNSASDHPNASPMNQMLQQRQAQQQMQQQVQQQQHPPPPPPTQFNNPFHNKNPTTPLSPFSNPNNPSSVSASAASSGSQQTVPPPPEPGQFLTLFGWSMDIMVSLVVAGTVSVSLFDLEHVLDDLSKVPLLPGHSTLAREFCPEATQLLQELQREAPDQPGIQRTLDRAATTTTPTAAALLVFSHNCLHRRRYEEQLRQEKGVVSPNYRVAIPPPGVPVPDDAALGFAMGDSTTSSPSSSSWTVDDDHSSFSTSDNTEDNNMDWANEGLGQDQDDRSR